MRILGIDPGLQITGYGVVDFDLGKTIIVDGGVFRFPARTSLAHRLLELEMELNELFDEHQPDICAVEQLYAHYKHPRTAILMGHARGVILLAAERRNVRIEQFSANRIKKSVMGHGHAGKMQIQRAIQQIFRLKTLPQPPDLADALAVAFCCGQFVMERR
ncbi:MAG: crossover junction endodeoxyribonuclease RuvC [Tepidisphaeraceae bacterium]|jgi:crossover junction endodeoxyribonuclease RuvC